MALILDDVMLREFRLEDLSEIHAWETEREVSKWVTAVGCFPHTYEQTESYLHSILDGNAAGVHYVIADLDTGRYMGQVSLFSFNERAKHAEMGIVLQKALCGQGIGRRAIALILREAFNSCGLNRVVLYVDADNLRAIRCYRACGFREEGRLRDDRYHGGAYHDTVIMSVLRTDWEQRQGTRVGEISSAQLRELYANVIEKDFPQDELRPYERMVDLRERGLYRAYALFEKEQLRAYACVLEGEQGLLLDYLGVPDPWKGHGYGTHMLKETVRTAGERILLLESEDPDAESTPDAQTARRRLNFYLCAGMRETEIRADVFGVRYRILCANCADDAEALCALDGLYAATLPEELYKREIRLRL